MELVMRMVIVYVFLLFLIRAMGKRELGQLSPFDFVVLLIISEAVQQAITDGDRSITGGLLLASTLCLLHIGLSVVSYRWQKLREIVNGVPVILVEDGKLKKDAMDAERVPEDDIESEARQVGIEKISQVKKAVLESSGKISIIPKEPPNSFARRGARDMPD